MIKQTVLVAVSLVLVGCSAITKQIRYGKLDVQTKMSDTIFLDPVAPAKKSIYLQLRDTTDRKNLNYRSAIADILCGKGYKVTQDPDAATFILKVNIRSVEKIRRDEEAWDSLTTRLTNVGTGASTAVMAGSTFGDLGQATPGFMLFGAAAEHFSDAAVEVVTYAMITDIQLIEKAKSGEKTHSIRVASIAKKTNLEFEEASDALSQGLVKTISGLFE